MTSLSPLFRSVRVLVALLLCFLLAVPVSLLAQGVPHLLNYQGRVAVDGQNFTGPGYFKFALVDSGSNQNRTATATASVSASNRISGITITDGGSGYTTPPAVTILGTGAGAVPTATVSGGAVTGIAVEPAGGGYAAQPPPSVVIAPPPEDVQISTLWTNDSTALGSGEKQPESWVELPVNKGLYSVLLGDVQVPGMAKLEAKTFSQAADLRLRVWFSTDRNTFTQLTPDQRIAAVGYAMMAEDVRDGSITSAKLAPGAVQMTQLAPELQQQLTALIAWQATQVPVVTNAAALAAAQDNFFSAVITATGSPSSYAVTGLPAGLTVNAATGVISGAPAAAGTFSLSLTATNIAGPSVPKAVTLTVHGPVHVDYAAGVDTNAGTTAAPVKTIKQGLALAASLTPKRAVRVSTAAHTVPEMLTLADGVSLYGGYTTGATWTRTTTKTPWHRTAPVTGEDVIAVRAAGLTTRTGVDGFRVTSADQTGLNFGRSSIVLFALDTTGLVLSNNELEAGDGLAGITGNTGATGATGEAGISPTGRTGGGNTLSFIGGPGPRYGGNGGGILYGEIQSILASPGEGSGGTAAAAGGSNGVNGNAATPGSPGGNGSTPVPAAGTHGTPATVAGIAGSSGFLTAAGGDGSPGGTGPDGRGGGGGGCTALKPANSQNYTNVLNGGGGGQGGAGGLGGAGGQGGKGGGASIAILLVNSSAACTGNVISTGNGGTGGVGGTGGLGGTGGQGGNGAPGSAGVNPGKAGGSGGDGGNGGSGGGGAGGSGGPSIGIVLSSGASLSTNTGNTFTLGTAGAGGLGGLRGGSASSRAATGTAGVAQNILNLP